jgi:ketosteroid isomerase-like protein
MINAAVLIALTMLGQAAAPAASAAEKAVRAADAARIQATVSNDFQALEKLLGDDLTYTHSSGVLEGKAQVLGKLRSGATRYNTIVPSDVRVRVYGDTAVMTGRAAVNVTVDGKTQDLLLQFTSVYVQRGGAWQFVAWQSTRVQQP